MGRYWNKIKYRSSIQESPLQVMVLKIFVICFPLINFFSHFKRCWSSLEVQDQLWKARMIFLLRIHNESLFYKLLSENWSGETTEKKIPTSQSNPGNLDKSKLSWSIILTFRPPALVGFLHKSSKHGHPWARSMSPVKQSYIRTSKHWHLVNQNKKKNKKQKKMPH